MLEHVAQHRRAVNRQLSGQKVPPEEVRNLAAAVNNDLKSLGVDEPSQGVLKDRLSAINKKWQRIGNRTPATTPAVSDGWHQELSDEVLGLNSLLLDEAVGQVGQSANARIKQVIWNKNYILGGVTAAVALTLVLVYFMLRKMTNQINAMIRMFSEIGMGNFQARAPVYSEDDELGQLALSLNAMLDNIVGLLQSREERDQIQASITKLLQEISGVAEGDLTMEADVTADVTGAIADSFNFMIEQLRRIISNVQDSTQQVSTAANQIHLAAEQLIRTISETAQQQAAASESIARSMNEISEITQKTTAGTRQGAVSVNQLAQLADDLRDSVSTFLLPGRPRANSGQVRRRKLVSNGEAHGESPKLAGVGI